MTPKQLRDSANRPREDDEDAVVWPTNPLIDARAYTACLRTKSPDIRRALLEGDWYLDTSGDVED